MVEVEYRRLHTAWHAGMRDYLSNWSQKGRTGEDKQATHQAHSWTGLFTLSLSHFVNSGQGQVRRHYYPAVDSHFCSENAYIRRFFWQQNLKTGVNGALLVPQALKVGAPVDEPGCLVTFKDLQDPPIMNSAKVSHLAGHSVPKDLVSTTCVTFSGTLHAAGSDR